MPEPAVTTLPRGTRERLAAVPMPARIAKLQRDSRGYPIPRFVDRKADKPDGEPDFRIMDAKYLADCIRYRICWVCGGALPRVKAFVVGPMCIVNRTSSEPPSHLECAHYSVLVCPFLAFPKMRRIDVGKPEGATASGIMIRRNPGVGCIWSVEKYKTWNPAPGEILFDIGEPVAVEWWADGRFATRAQVDESIRTGLPSLEAEAMKQAGAMAALRSAVERSQQFLPAA